MDLAEINTFIKQFEQMRVMMKGMSDMKTCSENGRNAKPECLRRQNGKTRY